MIHLDVIHGLLQFSFCLVVHVEVSEKAHNLNKPVIKQTVQFVNLKFPK